MKTITTIVFYASLALLLVSCWHRNEFSIETPVSTALLEEPKQSPIEKKPFEVEQDDKPYLIQPLHEYDLTGLIVSYEHHDGNYGLHRLNDDHINVADICVVWSDNLSNVDLNAFDFWNGQFTCNLQTRDSDEWSRFRLDQLSNNHLLATDDYVRKKIRKVRIGDQIRIKGWLSSYEWGNGYSRGTSVTRDDKGNGACETIYVEDFRILSSMSNGWRTLMGFSWVGVILSSMFWIFGVVRGIF